MADNHEDKRSLIDRKRPVVEGLIEDLLGPASLLDEIISSNPVPLVMDGENNKPVHEDVE